MMRVVENENQEFKDIFYMKSAEEKLLHHQMHEQIKNNLNTLASILGLQINTLDKSIQRESKDILRGSKMRVEAMAMIYESLFRDNEIEKVSFKLYVQNLTNLINKEYHTNISVEIEDHGIFLSFESMFHMGIILNELFTNTIKYAFTSDSDENLVKIILSQEGGHLHLVYRENQSKNIDIEKMLMSKTLGIRLIQLSVKQLNGTLKVTHNKGLIFSIDFLFMRD